MKLNSIIAAILALSLLGCENGNKQGREASGEAYVPVEIIPDKIMHISMNDSISMAFLSRGRKISAKAKVALKKELRKAIKEGGLEYAVEFCHSRALEITDSIALAEQVMIKRVARKNRNPVNETDEEQSKIFKGYILNWLGGGNMKSMVSWDDEGRPVYYNPIITESVCLSCHGKVGQEVSPGLAAKITELYPEDQATGFTLGEPRGMWAITFPQYMVVAAE